MCEKRLPMGGPQGGGSGGELDCRLRFFTFPSVEQGYTDEGATAHTYEYYHTCKCEEGKTKERFARVPEPFFTTQPGPRREHEHQHRTKNNHATRSFKSPVPAAPNLPKTLNISNLRALVHDISELSGGPKAPARRTGSHSVPFVPIAVG